MPNPKPKGGVRFKPGNKANPRGAGAHNKALKAIRRMTNDEIAEVGAMLLDNDLSAIKELTQNPKTSALKMLISSCLVKAIQKGDSHAMDIILNRVAGKQKEQVEFSGVKESPVVLKVHAMTRDERLKSVEEYQEDIKDCLDAK